MKQINVNIWDDYHDDGYVPEGEKQETYAYVECDLNQNDCEKVLNLIKVEIEQLYQPSWNLKLSVEFYDSEKVYPNLVGTEHAFCLYKRWQLEIKNLTHKDREILVEELGKKKLSYSNIPIVVYSES
jgi:hypothetical protein